MSGLGDMSCETDKNQCLTLTTSLSTKFHISVSLAYALSKQASNSFSTKMVGTQRIENCESRSVEQYPQKAFMGCCARNAHYFFFKASTARLAIGSTKVLKVQQYNYCRHLDFTADLHAGRGHANFLSILQLINCLLRYMQNYCRIRLISCKFEGNFLRIPVRNAKLNIGWVQLSLSN